MEIRLLRLPEVMRAVGLGRSAIYERINAGVFPRPIALGRNAVAWPSDVITKWIDERVAESTNEAAR